MSNPKFTNRLIHETSPYLLQHAHNPVDWFTWCDEAFETAKRENKPILLSVGYSACHWCHVMEHESFENEAIAELMNENFVCIKVDLEERPDLDHIYMPFLQMTTGSGGYPMNVFLTPDKIPFFGGTYFPPADRQNMPGFPRVLAQIAEAYRDKLEEILTSATQILAEINRYGSVTPTNADLSKDQLEIAYRGIIRNFDSANGGFGGVPKFPSPMALEFILKQYFHTKDENALAIVEKTCRKMAEGGIYDQLGGGFHRYATDAIWLVPHFEKMLYDNAQLARLYLHVWQATKNNFYKRIATETLDYVSREMLDTKGGFHTAQDADSEGVEGKFFVWEKEEIEKALGSADARSFDFYFDVSDRGNFEGKTILNINNSIEKSAEMLGVSAEKLAEVIENGRKVLYDIREKRIKPFRDEKILTSWNGLMLATFAEAAAVLNRDDYLKIAEKNADFLLHNLFDDEGLLLRTWKNGEAKLNGYLEDYACLADGLIALFEASGETRWLKFAAEIADKMISEFWDEENGGFFFTGKSHEELIVRQKDFFDNATPSGNSVALDVLLKLSKLLGDEQYRICATTIFRLIADSFRKFPAAFGRALSAFDFYFNEPKEIVIIGGKDEINEFRRQIWSTYLPNKIVVWSEEYDKSNEDLIPLLKDRKKIDGKPAVYICENYVCQKPAATLEELKKQLQF